MKFKIAWLADEKSVVPTVISKWAKGYGGPSGSNEFANMVIESEMKIYENHAQDARYTEKDTCPTVTSRYGTGGNNVPLVLMDAYQHHNWRENKTCGTLTAGLSKGVRGDTPLVLMDQGGGVMSIEHDKVGTLRAQTHGHEPLVLAVHENQLSECRLSEVSPPLQTPSGKAGRGLPVVLYEPLVFDPPHNFGNMKSHTISPTLLAAMGEGRNNTPLVISSDASNVMRSNNPYTGIKKADVAPTLDTVDPSPSKGQGGIAIVEQQARVRKLTPIECERLQGFPDNYTQIPWKGKPAEECPDSPRYKAIGNSWAVPCVRWIGKRIQSELEKNK